MNTDPATVTEQPRLWLEKAVIGLNLCPFAKAVHTLGRVRYRVSSAETPEVLVQDLSTELEALQAADPQTCETALLIHPLVLTDFLAYNDFLEVAEALVAELQLEGEIQVASFHPHYQFAGSSPDDIENFTNRSPYPTLHLLRESSIERALATTPEPHAIYERNIETLRRLGHEGWQRLWIADSSETK